MQDDFAPIDLATQRFPDAEKDCACRLSERIGVKRAAYIYDITPAALSRWRSAYPHSRGQRARDDPGA